MRAIVPHLWFDKEAGEAAELYTGLFENSAITTRSRFGGTPSGEVEMLTIVLAGQEFMLLSAGPYFKFTPAVSFLVACRGGAEVDRLWKVLGAGGRELMPLGVYPFSPRYGWTEDRFGLSWQIMDLGERPLTQRITPTLMFTGDQCGRAEEAMGLYTSLFPGSAMGEISRYGPGAEPNEARSISHGAFTLSGGGFAAMDSALEHDYGFNEAVSLVVRCDSQAEIDRYWKALSAHPEAEQCGWLKDAYGLSWQIVPAILDELMGSGDPENTARVTEAFLKMKKFDIPELMRAAGRT